MVRQIYDKSVPSRFEGMDSLFFYFFETTSNERDLDNAGDLK